MSRIPAKTQRILQYLEKAELNAPNWAQDDYRLAWWIVDAMASVSERKRLAKFPDLFAYFFWKMYGRTYWKVFPGYGKKSGPQRESLAEGQRKTA